MKINIIPIVRAHWGTLYNDETKRTSYTDIALFYIAPLLAGAGAYASRFTVHNDTYSVLITFFGIFLALLLNMQVAIFGIFQRKWTLSDDTRLSKIQKEQMKIRRILLSELNTNISYLTVISVIALVIFIVLFVLESVNGLGPAIGATLCVHFVLTLIMIVKRAHALFQKEYDDHPVSG